MLHGDISRQSHQMLPEYQSSKYRGLRHGVGLCDEWSLVAYPDKIVEGPLLLSLNREWCYV